MLTKGKYFADALSRTYYAVFHAGRAALQVKGVAAETHSGVRSMFGLYLIKPGEIEKEFATLLGESFDDRLSADYNVLATFNRAAAREECRSARRFLQRIRRFLRDNGFSAAELRETGRRKRKRRRRLGGK
jgi:uncharacterized protein